MPHVMFVPFTGLRVREQEMHELGMSLPGLKQRGRAVAQLPALGLLTLAGLTPPNWTCSYHECPLAGDTFTARVIDERPDLVAISIRPTAALWTMAVASLAIWAGVLPLTQPEQALRHSVESYFEAGHIDLALAEMSAHGPSEFPPGWEPPPRQMARWGAEDNPLIKVIEAMTNKPPAGWVRAIYLKKLQDLLRVGYFDDKARTHMLELLEKLPEAESLLAALAGDDADNPSLAEIQKRFRANRKK